MKDVVVVSCSSLLCWKNVNFGKYRENKTTSCLKTTHYGLRPQSKLVLEPQTLILFSIKMWIKRSWNIKIWPWVLIKMLSSASKIHPFSKRTGKFLIFVNEMFSTVFITKVSSNHAIRWPKDSKWSWRLPCPKWLQSENSGKCAILTRRIDTRLSKCLGYRWYYLKQLLLRQLLCR